ncbi:hypothetical protein ABIB25_003585 [Nakamurella sp. UYEF19]|uniref:IPT/TIG domain-containing protein n=1 Tax=Nakamurella sp. UYEF19 TaxID=1756392 RepID=UPI003394FB23
MSQNKNSGGVSTTTSAGRTGRESVRRALAAVVTLALVAGGSVLFAGNAAAATPVSQSVGRFLSGTALSQNLSALANLAPASATNVGAPATVTSSNPLDVTALNAVDVNLGGGVNLLGSNGILTLGAVGQYATASATGSSYASSGAIDASGAIATGAGVPAADATLNLGSLLGTVPALNGVVSAGTLSVGALAGTATETATGAQSGTYKIGSLSLSVTSPLVSGITTGLTTTLTALQPAVNALPGLIRAIPAVGALATISTPPNLATLVTALGTVTSADGSITANLQTGVVTIDVAKVLTTAGLNLNTLPRNTDLLPYITAALTSQLLPAITTALQGLITSITNAINGISVTVLGVPVALAVLAPVLNPVIAQVTAPITTLIGNLGSTVITPLATGLTTLLSLTANVEPTAPNAASTFTQSALSIGVIPGANTARVTLASATVGPNAGPLGAPTATSLAPNQGPIVGGTPVVIIGTNFVPGGSTVVIGGITLPPASVAVNADGTTASFTTPAHAAGPVGVTLSTPSGATAPLTFTYGPLAPPTPVAAGLSPNQGPVAGGTSVTITGNGFIAGTTVSIGGNTVAAGDVTLGGGGTTATFLTPAHAAGATSVTVTTTNGTSTPALTFTYLAAPTLASLNPDHGTAAGGTLVTITGTGLVPGATSVTIGGNTVAVGDVSVAGDGLSATFRTPAHDPGLVGVTVTTPGGTSTPALGFTYGPPIASTLSPTHGPATGGTSVTVTGSGFVAGATTVSIGGNTVAAGDVTVAAGGTTATFAAPAHAVGAVPVTVSTPGGTSTPALTYTYDPPTATSLSPDHGPAAGGTGVAITGAGFVPGNTTVTIDGTTVPATVTNNGTTATFTTPADNPGPVNVTVTTPDGTSSPALTYSYNLPTATSLSPNNGPSAGGIQVAVTGTGFVAGSTTVSIGGNVVPATGVTVTGNGTIATFTLPAHSPGAVNVTVTTPDGTTTPALRFVYGPPTATSLTPDHGPTAGGDTVIITGTGFVPGATTVTIDGTIIAAGGVTVNGVGTTASFTTPADNPGAVGVTVTTPGGTSTPALTYTYGPPTAAGLTPTHGPAAGGTSVVVTGTGFVPGATTVTIGGTLVPATAVTVNPAGTTATLATPRHAVGPVQVTVTTAGGTSAPLGYTYDLPTATSLDPDHGPVAGGNTVAITGTGFVAGSTTITIGGSTVAAGNVTVSSDGTTATFTAPSHAPGAVDVTVTTPDGVTTPALTYTYGPPTATSLTPTHGPAAGGTSVVISGTGFVVDATSVVIGGSTVPTTAVQVNPAGTTATFTTPGGTVGPAAVTVVTAGGTSAPALTFTYDLPTATSLTPDNGPVTGGTSVAITGTGFVPGNTTVTIDGTSRPGTVTNNGTTVTFTTPVDGPGAVGVTVTTPSGTTAPALTFTYGPPTATSLDPTHGPAAGGTKVTITGTGFVQGGTAVSIGAQTVVAANVMVSTDGTTASFTTPPNAAGAVNVTATTAGGTSTPGLTYTYDPPSATSLSPTHGPAAGGTSVTVNGAGFVPGATTVLIGGNTVAAANVAVNPAGTTATFTTPRHAVGDVSVTVTTPGGTTLPALPYTYDLPTATGLDLAGGPVAGGTSVTITGTGFVPLLTTVTIGGVLVPAPLVAVNAAGTTATFLTPPGAAPGPVDVTVTTPDGTTTPALTFVYGPPVAVTLDPTHGPAAGGTSVAITGAGFVAGATTVTIGGTTIPATGVAVDPTGTTATFTTPQHAVGPVQVTVTTAGGTSGPALTYTYDLPTATKLSPDHGPIAGGNDVIVTGTGFVPGQTIVTIDGLPVTATVSNNGTMATFPAPAHAPGAVAVTVTTPDGTTTPALKYTYGPPTATSLNPPHGPAAGGTTVTIIGTGFVQNGTTVSIGGNTVPAGSVAVTSDGNSATFTTPVHPVGSVLVTVTTAGGTSTPALGYVYDPPTALNLSPDNGPTAGGTLVTITGTGFVPGSTTVTIGGIDRVGTVSNSGTTVTFRTPAHDPGAVAVTVTTPDGTTLPALRFTYGPPTTASLTPIHGPTAGGTSVTITGTGFVPGDTTVAIGGNTVLAGAVTVNTAGTTATFTTPPHAVGPVDVIVTTDGGDSTPALTYTYDVLSALSLTPNNGPAAGGNSVTVNGTGFLPGATGITIGGVAIPASAIIVNAAGTTAIFTAPAHAVGGVAVAVKVGNTVITPSLGYYYGTIPVATCILTGGNAATVTVIADEGTATGLVASNFAVTTVDGVTQYGDPIAVTPALGGFLTAQISAPVPDGTLAVGYTLAPASGTAYPRILGGPITCTPLTTPGAGTYHPLTPARLLDTRNNIPAGTTTPIPAFGTLTLHVLGRGNVPATNVATVVVNVTATDPQQAGFVTVYPEGTRPNTSSLNFGKAQTVANLVATPVGADGNIRIYNGSAGTANLIADVQGYFNSGLTVAPGSYNPVAPSRILDTDNGIGTPTSTPLAAGGTLKLQVAGVAGVPATNVSAVSLNVTVDQTKTLGFVTVYPSGTRPEVSSLNFLANTTAANLVISPLAPDGSVLITNTSGGTVRLIADVSGYFLGGIPILDGEFVAVTPSRILDTRNNINLNGAVPRLGTIAPTMLGRNGIPATGVGAVVMNVTVDHPVRNGYITVYPQGDRPEASNLNFVPRTARPNADFATLGSDGKVRMFNGSGGTVDLITDVSGYFISNPLP